jgi:phage terminase small subunit
MNTLARREEDWGQLGPAMRALPNDRWRDFVTNIVSDPSYGTFTRAARKAGFGRKSRPVTLAKFAYRLSHDERIVAAIREECCKTIRVAHPEAARALLNLIRDPAHKDHGRAIGMILDRVDPVISRHDIEVTHRVIDPDQEALEELRALRQLGTSREKLLELFGGNGLARLERLEASDMEHRASSAKVIEASVVPDMAPDQPSNSDDF